MMFEAWKVSGLLVCASLAGLVRLLWFRQVRGPVRPLEGTPLL